MAVVEFVCPHCSGRFELGNPPAGEQVACPLCGGMLAIPAQQSRDDDAGGGEFDFAAHDNTEAAPLAFDVGELAPGELLPHRRTTTDRDERPVRILSRQEKEHRRQIRSWVWMIGGGILLAIAVAVLSRL